MKNIDIHEPRYLRQICAMWSFELSTYDLDISNLTLRIIQLMNKLKIVQELKINGYIFRCDFSDLDSKIVNEFEHISSIHDMLDKKRDVELISNRGIVFCENKEVEVNHTMDITIDFYSRIGIVFTTRNNIWMAYSKSCGKWTWQIDLWKSNNHRIKVLLEEIKKILNPYSYKIYPEPRTYEIDDITGNCCITDEGLYYNPEDLSWFIEMEGYPNGAINIYDLMPPLGYNGLYGKMTKNGFENRPVRFPTVPISR